MTQAKSQKFDTHLIPVHVYKLRRCKHFNIHSHFHTLSLSLSSSLCVSSVSIVIFCEAINSLVDMLYELRWYSYGAVCALHRLSLIERQPSVLLCPFLRSIMGYEPAG